MEISALPLVSFGWMSLVSGATGENLHGYSVQSLMETLVESWTSWCDVALPMVMLFVPDTPLNNFLLRLPL